MWIMMRLHRISLLLYFTWAFGSRPSAEPNLSLDPLGPYLTSRSSYVWTDNSRIDPLAPRNLSQRHRIVPFTIYSPSLPWENARLQVQPESSQHKHLTRSRLIHYLTPLLSQYYTEAFLSHPKVVPDGLLASLGVSHATEGNPAIPNDANHPVLIFSPAAATSRFLYGFMCASLSSLGYVVIALDSAYDTDIIELLGRPPISRSVPFCESNCTDEQRGGPNDFRLATRVRVADMSFLLDELSRDKASSLFDTGRDYLFRYIADAITSNRTGVIGHSLGGSAAVSIALHDDRVRAAINMDGTLFDIGGVMAQGRPAGHADCDKPYLLMGVPGHDTSTDSTWHRAWECFNANNRKQVRIRESRHYIYSDVSVLAERSMHNGRRMARRAKETLIGNVSGENAFAASLSIIDLFFQSTLIDQKWDNASWDQLIREWPVVEIVS